MELDIINYVVQNSFAIGVAIYLLYERSTVNTKIVAELSRITLITSLIYDKLISEDGK